MKIKIITEKKIANKFTKEAIKEYTKRLTKYCKIDQKVKDNIQTAIVDKDYIIRIGKAGASIPSEQLATKICGLGVGGYSQIAFVFEDDYNELKADYTLCIFNMDIHREIMLIILYEQLYRAYRIINNEPYHK